MLAVGGTTGSQQDAIASGISVQTMLWLGQPKARSRIGRCPCPCVRTGVVQDGHAAGEWAAAALLPLALVLTFCWHVIACVLGVVCFTVVVELCHCHESAVALFPVALWVLQFFLQFVHPSFQLLEHSTKKRVILVI